MISSDGSDDLTILTAGALYFCCVQTWVTKLVCQARSTKLQSGFCDSMLEMRCLIQTLWSGCSLAMRENRMSLVPPWLIRRIMSLSFSVARMSLVQQTACKPLDAISYTGMPAHSYSVEFCPQGWCWPEWLVITQLSTRQFVILALWRDFWAHSLTMSQDLVWMDCPRFLSFLLNSF